MKRAAMLAVLAVAWSGWLLASPAHAQDYRFRVPEMEVVLTVQPDASVIIEYHITFANERGAHPIDVVDVGMPTKDYKVLSASADGQPAASWKASTYIEIGPEVHLARPIPPGATGVFECRARVTDMVYADRSDKQRASLLFTPTWFGGKFIVGETDLLLVVKFPPGVHPDSVVWHSGRPKFFQKGVLEPDKVVFVAWKERYRLTGPKMFGCSFPRDVMQRVMEIGPLKRFLLWWERSKGAQQLSGILFIVLFAVGFLLLTRGTGITVLLICTVVFIVAMVKSPVSHFFLWPLVPLMGGIWYLGMHQRRPHYMPALARVEGGKVCRGLSAVEAAVLLEVPLHQVLAMAITELLSKEVIRVARSEPLEVEPVGKRPAPNVVELPDGDRVSLEPYEVGFMDVLSAPPSEVAKKDFRGPLNKAIGLVRYKMSGFDADATKAYYRGVTARAWDQVSREPDAAKKDDLANRHLNWLSIADDYEDRMKREREQGWYYDPSWYYSPGYGRRSDWMMDIRRWVSPAVERSSQGIVSPVRGLDLSGVDHLTLDALRGVAHAASEGGSGGGGGGCACACAGCACACACAGGGR